MILFQILTLFPERYDIFFNSGLPAKAIQKKLIGIRSVQLRDYADPERKGRVDDAPYGGGPGMILQIGPIFRALQSLPVKLPVILLTPQGERLDQRLVRALSDEALSGNCCNDEAEVIPAGQTDIVGGFTLICGFYEGIDQRVAEYLVDREISLGDFILNSGDPAAFCMIEAIARLVPGFMGTMESAEEESFESSAQTVRSTAEAAEPNRRTSLDGERETAIGADALLEYPQYSRPADFMGWKVPEILLSGHHGEVRKWRMEQRQQRTRNRGNYEYRTGTGTGSRSPGGSEDGGLRR